MFVQEVEVNLIITDYCMPGMTGFDLLKKVKVKKQKERNSIVFLSSTFFLKFSVECVCLVSDTTCLMKNLIEYFSHLTFLF